MKISPSVFLCVVLPLPWTAQAQVVPALKSGDKVYRVTCMAGPGLANALRVGDRQAWMARVSGGNWQDPDARLRDRIRVEEGKLVEQLKKAPAKG